MALSAADDREVVVVEIDFRQSAESEKTMQRAGGFWKDLAFGTFNVDKETGELTKTYSGFKMEMLSVMFLGQQISRIFGGITDKTFAWQDANEFLGDVLTEVTEGPMEFLAAGVETLAEAIEGAPQWAQDLIGVSIVFGKLAGDTLAWVGQLTLGASGLWKLGEWMKSIEPGSITKFFTKLPGLVGSWILKLKEVITDGLVKIYSWMKDSSLGGMIGNFFTLLRGNVGKLITKLKSIGPAISGVPFVGVVGGWMMAIGLLLIFLPQVTTFLQNLGDIAYGLIEGAQVQSEMMAGVAALDYLAGDPGRVQALMATGAPGVALRATEMTRGEAQAAIAEYARWYNLWRRNPASGDMYISIEQGIGVSQQQADELANEITRAQGQYDFSSTQGQLTYTK